MICKLYQKEKKKGQNLNKITGRQKSENWQMEKIVGLLSLMKINVLFLTLSALLSMNLILGFYFSLMLTSIFSFNYFTDGLFSQ